MAKGKKEEKSEVKADSHQVDHVNADHYSKVQEALNIIDEVAELREAKHTIWTIDGRRDNCTTDGKVGA